jgi:hypothetical protein
MDDSGTDMQVISHVWPTFEPHTPEQELDITRAATSRCRLQSAPTPTDSRRSPHFQ